MCLRRQVCSVAICLDFSKTEAYVLFFNNLILLTNEDYLILRSLTASQTLVDRKVWSLEQAVFVLILLNDVFPSSFSLLLTKAVIIGCCLL